MVQKSGGMLDFRRFFCHLLQSVHYTMLPPGAKEMNRELHRWNTNNSVMFLLSLEYPLQFGKKNVMGECLNFCYASYAWFIINKQTSKCLMHSE